MTYSGFPLRFSNSLETVYLQIEFNKFIYQTNEHTSIYARTNSIPVLKKKKISTKEKIKIFAWFYTIHVEARHRW